MLIVVQLLDHVQDCWIRVSVLTVHTPAELGTELPLCQALAVHLPAPAFVTVAWLLRVGQVALFLNRGRR